MTNHLCLGVQSYFPHIQKQIVKCGIMFEICRVQRRRLLNSTGFVNISLCVYITDKLYQLRFAQIIFVSSFHCYRKRFGSSKLVADNIKSISCFKQANSPYSTFHHVRVNVGFQVRHPTKYIQYYQIKLSTPFFKNKH